MRRICNCNILLNHHQQKVSKTATIPYPAIEEVELSFP
jgi:hypothetical protein